MATEQEIKDRLRSKRAGTATMGGAPAAPPEKRDRSKDFVIGPEKVAAGVEAIESVTPAPVRSVASTALDLILTVDRAISGGIKARIENPNVTPLGVAAGMWSGVQQKRTYSETAEGHGKGWETAAFAADLLAPGSFFIPYGAIGREVRAVAGGAKAATTAAVGAAAAKSERVAAGVAAVEHVGKAMRSGVSLPYKIERAAKEVGVAPDAAKELAEELIYAQRKHAGRMALTQSRGVAPEVKQLDALFKEMEVPVASKRKVYQALDATAKEIMPVENPEIVTLETRAAKLMRMRSLVDTKITRREQKFRATLHELESQIPDQTAEVIQGHIGQLEKIRTARARETMTLARLIARRDEAVAWSKARAYYYEIDPHSLGEVMEKAGVAPEEVMRATQRDAAFRRSLRDQVKGANDEIQGSINRLRDMDRERHRTWVRWGKVYGDDFVTKAEEAIARRDRLYQQEVGKLRTLQGKMDKRMATLADRMAYMQWRDAQELGFRNATNKKRIEELMTSLSPKEREAYLVGFAFNNADEMARLRGGVLKETTARGFEQERGTIHVGRRLNEKKAALAAVDDAIKEAAAQGTPLQPLLETRAMLEDMAPSRFDWLIAKNSTRIRRAGFLNQRKMKALVEEGRMADIFDHDLPRVLQTQSLQTAKAISEKMLVDDVVDELIKVGMPTQVAERDIVSGQWVKAPQWYPGQREVYLPKAMADEVFGAIDRFKNIDNPLAVISHVFGELVADPWRRITLFLSPEFYTRNIVGSVHNAWARLGMGIDSIPDYGQAAKTVARWHIGKFQPGEREFMEQLIGDRILHAGQSTEVARFISYTQPGKFSEWGNILSKHYKPINFLAEHAQGGIEDTMRLAAYYYLKRKNPKWTNREIADKIIDAHFDYQVGLTNFERGISNWTIPFYRWMRFNMPLQLRMLAEYPERYAAILRRVNSVQVLSGGPRADETILPGYLADDFHIRTVYDEETGDYRMIRGPGWMPSADIEKLTGWKKAAREGFQMQYPWLKAMIEVPFGVDLFRSEPGKLVPLYDDRYTPTLFGREVPWQVHYVSQWIRPVAQADRWRTEYQTEGLGAAVLRAFVGKAYPVDQQRYYEQYERDQKQKIGRARRKMQEETDPKKRAKAEVEYTKLQNELYQVRARRPAQTYLKKPEREE